MAVTITSCRKEESQSLGNNEQETLESMTQEDIQVRDKILSFRDNVGKHLKSTEVTNVEDAIWNIESAINYTYQWNNFQYKTLPNDTLVYELPLTTDGNILQTDVDNIYQQIIADLTVIYNNIDADTKHMIFTNIEQNEVNRDGLTSSITVVTGFGFSPLFVYGSFDEGEDWMWGLDYGMCDDNTIESDAAEEIEFLLNNPENPPSVSGRVYFTLPINKDLSAENWPNPDDDIPDDNIYDYLLFYNYGPDAPNYHECLTHEDMNFYLSGTANVINTYEPNGKRPIGKTFMTVNLVGTISVGERGHIITHMSIGELFYGTRHITNDPPIDL